MLEKIAEQEKLDRDSIESDLNNIVQTDNSNSGRKEKLNLLKTKRPVLPKEIDNEKEKEEELAHQKEIESKGEMEWGDGETVIVVSSATRNIRNLCQELVRTGSNMNLFPHLQTTLPQSWVEIENVLPTLIEEMKSTTRAKYLTFEELENWLCRHLQKFGEAADRKDILQAVLLYLVKLGKILHFKPVEKLKDLIFPDPQWLIMLVKEVVHHDLQSHLQFKNEFHACDMSVEKFNNEKHELVRKGLLSESLLRCIWFDAVPETEDCKKLVALLYHFDVGYKMTVKEAQFEGKEINKNYTLIPALMAATRPPSINVLWPTAPSADQTERSCEYQFYSNVPVGLFERQMVRSHQCSDYRIHWKEGFFGINSEEQDEVKFCITKENKKIKLAARINKYGQINTLWMLILSLHQTFVDMVQELWPELRYGIFNKCPECNKCHYEIDFERLLKDPHSYRRLPRCERTGQIHPIKVDSNLVIPPPGIFKYC